MGEVKDAYKTIAKASAEVLFKEKKSKFYGYAFPIASERDVKPLIEKIKAKHPNANHVCYAWQLGIENLLYRANDDREPNNSAGMPIYGQIQSFELTNILVAVACIFGGTKLGVGGLISAYRTTAQSTLNSCKIIEKKLQRYFTLKFQYSEMGIVMRTIKQRQMKIVSQKLEMECQVIISVREKEAQMTIEIFNGIPSLKIR